MQLKIIIYFMIYKKNLDNLSIELIKLVSNVTEFETLTIKEIQEKTWIDHPQKFYNRLDKLIKDWYISEDFKVLKMPEENKIILPFYWWAQCWHNWSKIFDEYPRERIEVNLEKNNLSNRNFWKFFITRSKWKSMEPLIYTWINLLIESSPFIWWNYSYLVKHNERAKIKQITKKKWKYFLHSINKDYPDVEVKEEENLDVIWIVKIIWVNF